MDKALRDNADDALYERSNLKNLAQLGKEAESFKNYVHFSNTTLKDAFSFPLKLEELSQLM